MNLEQEIILENEQVKLTPLDSKNYENLLPIALKYPKLIQFSPSPFGNEINLKAYIENALEARFGEQIRYPFVVFDKKKNRIVGSSSFGNISNKNLRLEIGWTWLDKQVQGTGLNKNIKFLMLEYTFNELQFERVQFNIDSRNGQSRRAIEKIGAQLEGLLRSHTVMPDGFRRTTACYSILKSEWDGLRKTVFADFSK
ncbi:MAG: RimJ/RimL family protein N-acetyltransferase [Flammeovirgaceae bacterium]|jgi:RimJ/RimL family protein N-acetyltransferase